jgi:FMN phosphatase YigB (HAD superfamily)
MPNPRTWLIDFDETLASGNLTQVFQHTFPKFIQENQLTYDKGRLGQVMLALQERARQQPDTEMLLSALFEEMEWPSDLKYQFLEDIRSNTRPNLFEDALPFLEQLREQNNRVYVVSNNKRTPDHVRLLGIEVYIDGVFTPHSCPDTQPKPHNSLWNYITAQNTEIDIATTSVIGDDPWSDGAFAEACGLPCWIVDRMSRFSHMYHQKPYRWVQSLLEISQELS